MSLLTPELLRWLEQLQLLAVRRVEFVATLALAPALSHRRGRILRCVSSHRKPSVLRKFSPANHQPAATGNSTSKSSARVHLPFPLPGGEGQGEGERHTNSSANHLPWRRDGRREKRFQNLCAHRVSAVGTSPSLPSLRVWPIVAHASAGRHRGRRMGRVVCHDAARTLARQRRVVGTLSVHRRFA